MNRVKLLFCSALLIGGAVLLAEPGPKVDVCHIPPGNPGNAHIINIR